MKMTEESLDRIKMESENFRLNPPERIWNRLEYKLDRFELKKQEQSRGRFIYIISAAAVIIILVGIISLIRSDVAELTINEKSELLIEDLINTDGTHEAYNIHTMKNYYNNLNTSRFKNNSVSIRVSSDIKG